MVQNARLAKKRRPGFHAIDQAAHVRAEQCSPYNLLNAVTLHTKGRERPSYPDPTPTHKTSSPMLSAAVLCLVLRVADGDTLSAHCPTDLQGSGSHSAVKLRLAEIDAPEKGQAFGQRSKRSLEQMCLGQWAQVRASQTDRYGRWVAHVQCRGQNVNSAQVSSGMAWVYQAYAHDPHLLQLQAQAQTGSVGLWVDAHPTPPWEFRRQQRNSRAHRGPAPT